MALYYMPRSTSSSPYKPGDGAKVPMTARHVHNDNQQPLRRRWEYWRDSTTIKKDAPDAQLLLGSSPPTCQGLASYTSCLPTATLLTASSCLGEAADENTQNGAKTMGGIDCTNAQRATLWGW